MHAGCVRWWWGVKGGGSICGFAGGWPCLICGVEHAMCAGLWCKHCNAQWTLQQVGNLSTLLHLLTCQRLLTPAVPSPSMPTCLQHKS
jgi:hypothetical protein